MIEQVITEAEKPVCLQMTLKIIGDKWTGLILQDLANGPMTFSSLESSLPHISPRTLSQRLHMLETAEIIEKKLYCERPPRSKYEITEKGLELQEVLTLMTKWGAKYGATTTCE